jgi:hypothetical protein
MVLVASVGVLDVPAKAVTLPEVCRVVGKFRAERFWYEHFQAARWRFHGTGTCVRADGAIERITVDGGTPGDRYLPDIVRWQDPCDRTKTWRWRTPTLTVDAVRLVGSTTSTREEWWGPTNVKDSPVQSIAISESLEDPPHAGGLLGVGTVFSSLQQGCAEAYPYTYLARIVIVYQ